jgi:hypothetical protein
VAVDDGHWMDRWRRSDGDEVLLPVNGREVYARQPGWTLLEERAYDRRIQMAADGAAAKWRGTNQDTVRMPEGPTAYFPARG